jgi:hypothetical protein
MSLQSPSSDDSGAAPADIVSATEALFEEIANASMDPNARANIVALNSELRTFRQYEDALFPDRQAEYDALADCWRRRDLTSLLPLINAYFERRQAIRAEWVRKINHPN